MSEINKEGSSEWKKKKRDWITAATPKTCRQKLKVILVFCTSDHLHYQVNRQQVTTRNWLWCKVGFCPTDPKLPQKCHGCPEIAALAADTQRGAI